MPLAGEPVIVGPYEARSVLTGAVAVNVSRVQVFAGAVMAVAVFVLTSDAPRYQVIPPPNVPVSAMEE